MKKTFIILTTFFIAFAACKKDDTGDKVYLSNGSVTGTIKGLKQDNSSINETFSFNQYLSVLDEQYYKIDPASQIYHFNIEYRSKNNSYINLEFTLASSSDNTPDNVIFSIDYYKDCGNSIFHFDMRDSNNNIKNTNTINDFSFDKATGRVKCKLAMAGLDNSTENDAQIEASFDVILKQLTE